MNSANAKSFLEFVIDLRNEVSRHLPIGNSLIMFDLIFRISISHQKNQDLSIKQLFTELPHSEMGMRYHFRRLEKRGWIQIIQQDGDRRSRFIIPTEKLIKQVEALTEEIIKRCILI